MTFTKIIPRARSSSGDIRVSFSGGKTLYANVCFSFSLLDSLGWRHDCRLFVYIDDEDPKMWMIEKADEGQKDTFKLSPTKGGKTGLSKLQFKFSGCEITAEDKKLKVVIYEIRDGNIILVIPRAHKM